MERQPWDPCGCVLPVFPSSTAGRVPGMVWSAASPLLPAAAQGIVAASMAALQDLPTRRKWETSSFSWDGNFVSRYLPVFFIFPSPIVHVLSGNKSARGWRCVCSLPGGSSFLGTRSMSGLNGDTVGAGRSWTLSLGYKQGLASASVGCKGRAWVNLWAGTWALLFSFSTATAGASQVSRAHLWAAKPCFEAKCWRFWP